MSSSSAWKESLGFGTFFYLDLIQKYLDIYLEYIQNVHGCACVFNMVYAEFIWIMYGYAYHVWTYHDLSLFALTSQSLGTFVFLLTGFGVWSFCSASPCLNGLSLCLIAGAQLIVFPVYLFTLVPRPHVQQSRFVLGKKKLIK